MLILELEGNIVTNLIDQKLIYAEVVDINWERINLYIDIKVKYNNTFDKNFPLDFYAVNEMLFAKAKFKAEQISENIFRLHLNITNPGYNRCLPTGNYAIFICQGNNLIARCTASTEIVNKMNDFSRSFLYGNRSKVYNVVFYVDDTDAYSLPFVMSTLNSSAIPDRESKNSILNQKKLFSKKAKICFIKGIYKLLLTLNSHCKKNVLFLSEQNKEISGNLKAVSDRMIERGLDKEFTLLYSFRSSVAEHQSFFSVIKLINKLSKCTTLIMDDHAPIMNWLKIDKKTNIIQLWHAGAGFKAAGYSRWGNKGCPSPYSCHRQYNYGIAGSKNIAPFFSEVWGINTEQVLPTGMPRLDEYLNEDYREAKIKELYKRYPACESKKVILFAPTYRGKNKAEAYYPYELIDFKSLYELCSDEYVVLFKMHPWVSKAVPIPNEYKDKFIDAGTYPNINDLFYITKLLITDYSSNIFEYSIMRNPMIFFAFDEIQYSFSRGFHRDFELSAPGKIVHTFDELLSAIKNKDFDQEKVDEYVEHHFDYIDTHASDRVIDWLILGNIPEHLKKSIDDKFDEVKHTANLDFKRFD